jgi:hypothetical protein
LSRGGRIRTSGINLEPRGEVNATTDDQQIRLTIKGTRAERGVSLSDFESFIDSFLAALRDYDRAGRGEPTRRSGHPDRRAEAVTAFRLVGFRTGSGVAIIEPEFVTVADDQLPIEDVPVSLATLTALADDLRAERHVPEVVLDSLRKACSAAGTDGSIALDVAAGTLEPVLINGELLNRLSDVGQVSEADAITSISGRLHLVDLEPDRVGIRTARGVEWVCRYPEALEERIKGLIDRIVWVQGDGRMTSALRGSLTIERIESVESEQSALFTLVPVDEDLLLARQGIVAPQGLDGVSDPEWDDTTDDAYLAALLSK